MRSPQVAHAHVCVYLRRAHRCVAEEMLDAAQVGAVLEQMRGERVPKRMRRALGKTGCGELAADGPADVARAERAAADAHEDARRSRVAPSAGRPSCEIAPEGARRGSAERDHPVLAAFPGHAHDALIGIHVGDLVARTPRQARRPQPYRSSIIARSRSRRGSAATAAGRGAARPRAPRTSREAFCTRRGPGTSAAGFRATRPRSSMNAYAPRAAESFRAASPARSAACRGGRRSAASRDRRPPAGRVPAAASQRSSWRRSAA